MPNRPPLIRGVVPAPHPPLDGQIRHGGNLDPATRMKRGRVYTTVPVPGPAVPARVVVRTVLVFLGAAFIIIGGGRLLGMAAMHFLRW